MTPFQEKFEEQKQRILNMLFQYRDTDCEHDAGIIQQFVLDEVNRYAQMSKEAQGDDWVW